MMSAEIDKTLTATPDRDMAESACLIVAASCVAMSWIVFGSLGVLEGAGSLGLMAIPTLSVVVAVLFRNASVAAMSSAILILSGLATIFSVGGLLLIAGLALAIWNVSLCRRQDGRDGIWRGLLAVNIWIFTLAAPPLVYLFLFR